MKNKVPVQTALERASQLAYSLENTLRANKADYNYTLEMVVKIKNQHLIPIKMYLPR